MNIRCIIVPILLVAALVGAWAWLRPPPAPRDLVQGYVEGNFVLMAPEESGRIEALAVKEGDLVKPGERLFALEASMQTGQRDEARARLMQAQAQLDNLKAAQQRPEQIAVLTSQEERAKAALDLTTSERARQKTLFDRGYSSKAALDQAQAAFERDTAALAEIRHQIEVARLTGRTQEIGGAEAAVAAARATLDQAQSRLDKRRVAAADTARVEDIYFRAGEVVNAGQPVLSLLPPGNLKFRFYVPEPMLSRLTIGGEVSVTCDRCGSALPARVSFIAREAEYTPPVIFSREERAKLVFRVEAKPMRETNLPVGLPVDVRLTPAEKMR